MKDEVKSIAHGRRYIWGYVFTLYLKTYPGNMKILFRIALLIVAGPCLAQTPDSDVLTANAQIDAGVVRKNIKALENLYADDFVFTHGTGHVDNKASWLKGVQNPEVLFLSRKQDSTKVEMHGDIAIVTGRLDIEREQNEKVSKYGIWYVRVFVRKANRWQVISHRTTKQW
jgi:ketosteroid isomerase-like protein